MSGRARRAGISRPTVGLIAIGALVLGLQIPVAMIRGLIEERRLTRDQAGAEVAALWGGEQSVAGPRLRIPYVHEGADGLEEVRWASFLPERLDVDGVLRARTLSRGLFRVPVYDGELRLAGLFEEPDFAALGVDGSRVLWGRSAVVIEIGDARAVGAEARVTWHGEGVDLQPGTGSGGVGGVHAPVEARWPAPVEVVLPLRGSAALWIAPFARDTRVSLSSDWPAPSFGGAWLPSEREVGGDGFTAEWRIPFLGRDFAQSWLQETEPRARLVASLFGVELVSTVDPYRMAERSTKYATLFLGLTFGVLWLLDTLVGVRVHPIQLLLIGGALCLFYLLELSLAEHVGFIPAYVVAAGAVVALISGYARTVLRSTRRGVVTAALLGALYAYLLTLLRLEEYALLAGSAGLFTLLGVTMYLTRWIDWEGLVSLEREAAGDGGAA